MLKIFINAALAVMTATAVYSSAGEEDPSLDERGTTSFSRAPVSPSQIYVTYPEEKRALLSYSQIRGWAHKLNKTCPTFVKDFPGGNEAFRNLSGISKMSENLEKLAQTLIEESITKIQGMGSLYVRILSYVRRNALSASSTRRVATIPHPVDRLLDLNESDGEELEKRNSAITIIYDLSLDDLLTYERTNDNDYETHELAIRRSVGEIAPASAVAFANILNRESSNPLSGCASLMKKVNWRIATVENAVTAYNASDTGKTYPITIEIVMEMVSRFPAIDFGL